MHLFHSPQPLLHCLSGNSSFGFKPYWAIGHFLRAHLGTKSSVTEKLGSYILAVTNLTIPQSFDWESYTVRTCVSVPPGPPTHITCALTGS